MIAESIRFILSSYPFSFPVIGLLAATLSLLLRRQEVTRRSASETFLSYYCLFAVGLAFIDNFIMHVFFAPMAAAFIGWQNSPFQYEVGFASLGFGIVGLLAYRGHFGLRLAAVTGPAFFLWGAAAGHIYQIVVNRNFSPGNAGLVLWTDLLVPIIGFVFLWGSRPMTEHQP